MSDITKIQVDGEPESSYQLYPRNNEFAKRAGGNDSGAGGSGVQSDWNQNDKTAPDYVKNRPFYTGDPVETVLLEETTITITIAADENLISSSFPYSFEVGQTYVITFDGVDTEYPAYELDGVVVVGYDYSLVVGGSGYIVMASNGAISLITKDSSLAGSHTIVIKGYTQEIIKIDAKYLPSDNAPYKVPIVINKDLKKLTDKEKEYINDAFKSGALIIYGYDENHGGKHSAITYFNFDKSTSLFQFTHFRETYIEYYDSSVSETAFVVELSNDGLHEIAKYETKNILQEKPLNYFVIASSTAGSAKRFKITVDDSGTLTTTEVT